MANLIRQPQTYNFAGNIADIVLMSDVPVTFSIPLLLEEVYHPDSTGRITIPLRAFFEAHLHAPDLNDIPDTGLPLTLYTYYLDGAEAGTFYVLSGGVAAGAIDTQLFLKSNFLTWQPQTRRVSYHEPQWLLYVALQACSVKVTGYFAEVDPVTVTLKELAELTQYSLDLNYGRIRGLFDKQPTYYDVWVEAGGERLSFVQRYVLREDDADTTDCFVFENSLGGFDTIRFTGDRKEVAEAESRNAVFDGDTGEYGVDYSKAWLKQTGYIPDERTRVWVLEFFSSCRRYHLGADSLNRIFVTKPKLEATSGEAAGYEFTFAYSHQSRYLNIARDKLPEQLEIIGPGDELFFLTPRLNEFPLLDPTQDILIPGQYPFTEQWGVLSLASLVATLTTGGGSGGNGTFYHDQLKNLDIPNQHPIKVISGLQAALDKKLARSEFDIFVGIYNNHISSDAHLNSEQKSILSRFSIVDGNLQIEGNAYATQSLSQYGPASGEGSGGGGTLYHDLLEHTDWPDLHPIGAITGLQSALDGKAAAGHLHTWASLTEKPTTLAGFGITDAVSATAFDDHLTVFNTHLSSNLHLTAAQRAVLSMLSVDDTGNLKVDGNAYTSGWLSQVGPATGNGSGGGGGTAYHDLLLNLDYPDQHPIAAITGLQTALDGKANAADIPSWALQSSKPSYAFSELTDTPTTLAGYGITDAMTAAAVNNALAGKANKNGDASQMFKSLSLKTGYLNLTKDGSWNYMYIGRGDTISSSYEALDVVIHNPDGKVMMVSKNDPVFVPANNMSARHCIWHAGNSNLPTVDWSTNNLTVAGSVIVDGNILVKGTITQLGAAGGEDATDDPFVERPVPGEYWNGKQVYVRSFKGQMPNLNGYAILTSGIDAIADIQASVYTSPYNSVPPGFIYTYDNNLIYELLYQIYSGNGLLYLSTYGQKIAGAPYVATIRYTKA